MVKNYYVVLGLTPEASPEAIQDAYRQKALATHPDRTGSHADPFLELQEAYHVLGDAQRRDAYDRERRARRHSQPPEPFAAVPLVPPSPHVETFQEGGSRHDLGDISLLDSFATYAPSREDIFQRLLSNFAPGDRPKAEHAENLVMDVAITPDQAQWGGHAVLGIPTIIPCPTCEGHGGVGTYECWRCAGHGALIREQPVRVAFPPGVSDCYILQVPLAQFGIQNLHLTVRFRVSQHEHPCPEESVAGRAPQAP